MHLLKNNIGSQHIEYRIILFVVCYYSNGTNVVSKYLSLSLCFWFLFSCLNVNAVIFNYETRKKIFTIHNLGPVEDRGADGRQ